MTHSDKEDLRSAFDRKLAEENIYGQWMVETLVEQTIGGPRPGGLPHLWKWATVKALLDESCIAVPESSTARRSLMFNNPGLKRGTTHTLSMGIQAIRPGEVAWSHRHLAAALRFAISGSLNLITVVDGEACVMEDHDLVLTPGWTWHDHHNDSDKPAAWLDVLDVPLTLALNQSFYEPFGESAQPLRPDCDHVAARLSFVRPVWERKPEQRIPFRYPWKDVEDRLRQMRSLDGSPYDGVALEYVNPLDGGPTLPTLSAWVHWLKPAQETRVHRRSSSAVYFVVAGRGRTIIDDKTLQWDRNDCFCVPNWSWHRHINDSRSTEAILFSVHDIPVLQALQLYREEPEISLRGVQPTLVPADAARRKILSISHL